MKTLNKFPGFNFTFQPLEDTITVKQVPTGFEVRYLITEEEPINPRTDFDNLGTMVCFHKRYGLGDNNHGIDSKNYTSYEDMRKGITKLKNAVVILPIYMYDHGGLTIKTTPFSCHWDSRQLGFIYASREAILKEYSTKRITKKLKETVTSILIDEISLYDQYLTGDVYCMVLEKYDTDKKHLDYDTLGGVYGYDYAREALETEI